MCRLKIDRFSEEIARFAALQLSSCNVFRAASGDALVLFERFSFVCDTTNQLKVLQYLIHDLIANYWRNSLIS